MTEGPHRAAHLGAMPGAPARLHHRSELRPDNMIVDRTGKVWICDWNWLSLGARWTDLVGLLVTVHGGGRDAEAVLRRSWLLDGVDPDAVDAWLALIAAFMCGQAGDETPDYASPWLGSHRSYFGTAALSWLEQRRSRPGGGGRRRPPQVASLHVE